MLGLHATGAAVLGPADVDLEGAVTEQTEYRWPRAYGGRRSDQAKRLKELEKENVRLKKLVAELSLDKQMLEEIAAGKFCARRSGDERSRTSRKALRCPRDGQRLAAADCSTGNGPPFR